MSKNLLLINSSGRLHGSVTRQLSNLITNRLQSAQPDLKLVSRELTNGLPFVNEQWIGANFTSAEDRDASQKEALSYSDKLVEELQQAKIVVIASPIYNYSIPAVLKAWIDLVARAGLTFKYTENGPVGLIPNKKVYIVMASGGVPIGSEMDFASPYLKQALAFVGLTDLSIVDASTINLSNASDEKSAEQQVAELVG